jgi:hypothetical protein
LGKRWGQNKPPNSNVNRWLKGTGGCNAFALREIAQGLDVSADWLLFGRGTMRPDQHRATAELSADLAAEIARRLYQRLRAPQTTSTDDRFDRLELRHIKIEAADLLDRMVDDVERSFRADTDVVLYDANRERVTDTMARLIMAFAKNLPHDMRNAGARAAATIARDAATAAGFRGDPIVGLTEEGLEVLLRRWETPGAVVSAIVLERMIERSTRRTGP